MLIKIYKGTGIAVIFLLLITATGLWMGPMLKPQLPVYYSGVNSMPLFTLVRDLIGENARWGVLISYSLVLIISVLLSGSNLSGVLISERTLLPAASFVIISAFIPSAQTLNPALFASAFLLLALMRINEAYKKSGIAYNFFDAAFLISTGSLFYADLIWMQLIVFFAIIILRAVSLKELAISMIGVITPYIILYGTFYSLGNDLNKLTELIISNLFGESGSVDLSRMVIVTLVSTGFYVIVSLFNLASVVNAKKIRTRKVFSLLIWILVFAILEYVFLPSTGEEMMFIAAIPVSYLLSHNYFNVKRKIVPEIFFTVVLILTILVQIFYY